MAPLYLLLTVHLPFDVLTLHLFFRCTRLAACGRFVSLVSCFLSNKQHKHAVYRYTTTRTMFAAYMTAHTFRGFGGQGWGPQTGYTECHCHSCSIRRCGFRQVQAANAAAGRSCAAQQLLQQRVRTADSAAVSSLWRNFRKCDREASGKLSSSEFAAALQSSKLGFSSAEVLQVANGLADSDGLLDYRPVGRMLRSQGSGNPALQGVNSAEAGAKKPPLPRPSSSKAERSNRVAQSDQTAANDDHAAQRRTPSAAPAAASSTVQVQQHGSDAGLGHSPTTGGWSEPMQAEAEHQQAAQSVACAAVQPAPNRATLAGSKAGSDSLSGAKRPGTAPCKKAAGPPAQKVSYFFSKGQIDMQQPYEWKPSKDDTAIQDAASRGVYVRSWSTGHTRNKPLQVSLLCRPVSICT